jgi:hypothetical protein
MSQTELLVASPRRGPPSSAAATVPESMYLTRGFFVAGAIAFVYGLWQHDLRYTVAGLIAMGTAAIFRRAKDKILVRVGGEKGVEVQATIIPPPDDPDATP